MKAYSVDINGIKKDVKVTEKENIPKMEENIINLYPEIKKHKVFGFGGALTHASGEVLNSLSLPEAMKVLKLYFKDASYSFIRIPIDSSDFASHTFEAAESKEKIENDEFSFKEEEEYIFPWLDRMEELKGEKLSLLLSPWSPPAFMKTNGSRLLGGRLKDEFYSLWAKYISRYTEEYIKRGYNVWALTLQNESNAKQIWDSCMFSSEEESKLYIEVKKALIERGLNNIEILFWDHNKERIVSRLNQFEMKGDVSGMAFHGYMGDHFENLDIYRRRYPKKRLVLSEFCLSIDDKDNKKKQRDFYFHEIVNDLYYGADTIIDWNLILSEEGGPNHVGNFCISPVMKNGERAETNMCYWVMKTLSNEIQKNDEVIERSLFDSNIDFIATIDKKKTIHMVFISSKVKNNIRIGEKVFEVKTGKGDITVVEIEKGLYE